jgi:hypothetical protein
VPSSRSNVNQLTCDDISCCRCGLVTPLLFVYSVFRNSIPADLDNRRLALSFAWRQFLVYVFPIYRLDVFGKVLNFECLFVLILPTEPSVKVQELSTLALTFCRNLFLPLRQLSW